MQKRNSNCNQQTHYSRYHPDERGPRADKRNKLLPIFGDFPDQHAGQAGIGDIAHEHRKGENEGIFAKFGNANRVSNG